MSDERAIDPGRYLAGLQCERRLWLASRSAEPGASAASSAEREAWARTRRELREIAFGLFPGARRVAEPDFGRAVARTRELLADSSVRVIAGAVFASDGANARLDFVERLGARGFGLRQVRAALRPSEAALDELAFRYHVARSSGLEVVSVEVVLLDADCVRGTGAPEPRLLLRRVDVTGQVRFLAGDLETRLEQQRSILARERAPDTEPSPHCRRPDSCEFLAHCTAEKPPDWIGYLPALRANPFAELRARGIERIRDLEPDFSRTPAQRNARESVLRGTAFATSDLARRLSGFGPPADALDFEAILPEIPVFAGTRPFEVIPFQWSAWLAAADSEPVQAEFLADGRSDPRREFAESLLNAFAPRTLPILVYSGFESEVLGALSRAFPDLADGLERLRARLRDLLPVVRRSVYHPAFLGSFSLKRVAPALCQGFTFSDLPGIADGGAASRAWLSLARGELSPERGAGILGELREYCARDALALVRLLVVLRNLEPAHSDR
jgi:hypothetical protein